MHKLDDPTFEDNQFLIDVLDCDGDRLTVSAPWNNDDDLMMRIENDDTINGIIINLPIALALIGILLPMIQTGRFDEKVKEYMDPDIRDVVGPFPPAFTKEEKGN
jgi:hypothetical protein